MSYTIKKKITDYNSFIGDFKKNYESITKSYKELESERLGTLK